MKRFFSISLLFLFSATILFSQTEKILIVTGGKAVDKENFYNLFKSFSYDTTSKPFAFQFFDLDKIDNYKAIVFYDTYQPITEEQKESFMNIFEKGIGVLFLHHSLVSHQEWNEYEKIIGGKYFHQVWVDNEKKYGPSTYKHDQDFVVEIINRNHPVTNGLDNFEIHDETYLNYRVLPNVSTLLRTDYRESGEILGWTHTYKNSKVVYIMMGHDKNAFNNKSYKKLVENSIYFLINYSK